MSLSKKDLNELRVLYYKGLSHCFVNVKTNSDAKNALYCLNEAAQGGYADAYFALGDIYLCAFAGDEGRREAFNAYYKGYEIASAKCAYGLSFLTQGEENSSYEEKAFEKLFEEASQEDEISQYIISTYFLKGLGSQKISLSAYIYWLKEAALGGYVYALQEMGDCYRDGFCVPQDLQKANEWYIKGGLKPIDRLPQEGERGKARRLAALRGEGERLCANIGGPLAPEQGDLHAEQHSDNNKTFNAFGERSPYREGQNAHAAPLCNGSVNKQEKDDGLSRESNNIARPNENTGAQNEGCYQQERDTLEEKAKIPLRQSEKGADTGEKSAGAPTVLGMQGGADYSGAAHGGETSTPQNSDNKTCAAVCPNSQSDAADFPQAQERGGGNAILFDKQREGVSYQPTSKPGKTPKEQLTQNSTFSLLLERATSGDAEAQTQLALMYEKGEGIKQDYDEAARWYQEAAHQEDPRAQNNLGAFYQKGISVKRDPFKGAVLYKKASSKGYVPAKYNLALCHLEGLGAIKSYVAAAQLLEEASETGYAAAYFVLGALYQSGKGVEKNLEKAADLYLKAYNGGIRQAYENYQLCLNLIEKHNEQ